MPPKHFWTPARDEVLRTHRTNRASWTSIALSLGVTPDVARERARAMGVRRPVRQPESPEPSCDPERPPLPPGHPIAWSVLTEGTLLAGTAYPWPPLPPASDAIEPASP